jgi:hypothetical protein
MSAIIFFIFYCAFCVPADYDRYTTGFFQPWSDMREIKETIDKIDLIHFLNTIYSSVLYEWSEKAEITLSLILKVQSAAHVNCELTSTSDGDW